MMQEEAKNHKRTSYTYMVPTHLQDALTAGDLMSHILFNLSKDRNLELDDGYRELCAKCYQRWDRARKNIRP